MLTRIKPYESAASALSNFSSQIVFFMFQLSLIGRQKMMKSGREITELVQIRIVLSYHDLNNGLENSIKPLKEIYNA